MGYSGSKKAYLTLFLCICAEGMKGLLMLSMQQNPGPVSSFKYQSITLLHWENTQVFFFFWHPDTSLTREFPVLHTHCILIHTENLQKNTSFDKNVMLT